MMPVIVGIAAVLAVFAFAAFLVFVCTMLAKLSSGLEECDVAEDPLSQEDLAAVRELTEASLKLERWLGRNAGTTADYPVRITVDNKPDAERLCFFLRNTRLKAKAVDVRFGFGLNNPKPEKENHE